jgi:hypothetical protein
MKTYTIRLFPTKEPITTPMKAANIWNIDTGSGKWDYGKLTIMNIETLEYWQD